MPPTLATLSALSAYDDVEDVLGAAAARRIRPVLPRVLIDEEAGAPPQLRFVLPDDSGYPR
jgi:hypothetical protein